MAPFSCNGTRIILNNQVLGSQGTHLEMNNRVPKIDIESMENVDSSSSSNKTDELCWDILLWLRTAALDPCKQKPPLEKLRRRQILKAREHISLSTTEFPWKKRRLDLVENKSAISPPLAKTIEQTSFASSVSCLISCTDSTEMSQQCICKPISVESSRCRNDFSRKRVRDSHFDGFKDFISVTLTPEKPNIQNILMNQSLKEINKLPLKRVRTPEAKITTKKKSYLCDSVGSVDNLSVSSENSQEKHKTARRSPGLQNQSLTERNSLPLKQVCTPEAKITTKKDSPLSDSVDSVDNLSVSSENSQEKHKTARRSPRLHNFIGDDLPRIEVKIGKRHQADIPDWIGPRKSDNSSTDGQSDSFDSRYMGTKIWPIEGKSTETNKEERIGKGRSNSCSCYSKGCGGCIKLHVFKKGLQLQDDLGTAFFTWKFDEMGEEVSNSWTAAEQRCFETLVKTDPTTQTESFLESALKRFPGKCKKSIVTYYFNVFIPGRISKQTRLASKFVNSDDNNDVFG
ncbi:hypothetical protein C5167_020000 [Papaver somniferum]|uniref:ELM2 domain-containing protein n=1 Tax=Papaver somniferum TaxID=3469 RepID=A0A4Y7ISA4_PAPSO|nr:uncharacterized protein LOC113352135 [Papaver somniferum]RZC51577.1 hypothetical protein C5167_020000 [Papaver somniferum]